MYGTLSAVTLEGCHAFCMSTKYPDGFWYLAFISFAFSPFLWIYANILRLCYVSLQWATLISFHSKLLKLPFLSVSVNPADWVQEKRMQESAGIGSPTPARCMLPIPPCNNVCNPGHREQKASVPTGLNSLLTFQGTKPTLAFHELGEALKAHSRKHKGVFERGTKVPLRTIKIGVSISVRHCDKAVPALEFPYLSLSSLWDWVPTGELATRLEATSSGTWEQTLSVCHKRKFHLNKTFIFRYSLCFKWIKLSLRKVLRSLLGKLPVPTPIESKGCFGQSPWSTWGLLKPGVGIWYFWLFL